MYEHETLQDELDRRDGIPDYYDTMYLDGYDVNQICRAFDKVQRKKFRKIRQEKQEQKDQKELQLVRLNLLEQRKKMYITKQKNYC